MGNASEMHLNVNIQNLSKHFQFELKSWNVWENWFLVYIKMIYPFTCVNSFSLLLILLDAHLAVWGQQRVPGLGEVCEELSGLVSKVPGVEH